MNSSLDASQPYWHEIRQASMQKNKTWTYASTTTVTSQSYYRSAVTIQGVTFNYRTKTVYTNVGGTVTFYDYTSFEQEIVWQAWNDPQADPADVAYGYGTSSSTMEIYQNLQQNQMPALYPTYNCSRLSTVQFNSDDGTPAFNTTVPVNTYGPGYYYCSPGQSNVRVNYATCMTSQ